MIIKINNIDEYNNLFKEQNKPIILWFTADWCGPCKNFYPFFDKFSNMFDESLFVIINIDILPEIADAYSISSIPTFIFLKNNIIFDILKGGNSEHFFSIMSNLFKSDIDNTLVETLEEHNKNKDINTEIEIDSFPEGFDNINNDFSFI